MTQNVNIEHGVTAHYLRDRVRQEKDVRVARKALAIALVLEGHTRIAAARAMGIDRQALRDAIRRFETEGWDGLYDRPRSGRPPKLTPEQLAVFKAKVQEGPPPDSDLSKYGIGHLVKLAEQEFAVSYTESGLRALLKSCP